MGYYDKVLSCKFCGKSMSKWDEDARGMCFDCHRDMERGANIKWK